MADFERSEYPVYLGFWTNWSYGRTSGLTLTLTSRNGAFLTAFLALFVSFTGICSWRIARFALHQYFSTDTAQDGLYHQRQNTLRNASSGMSGLISLIRILKSWRLRSHRPYYRLVPLVTIISLSVMVFAALSILSAKIGSEMGDEVLISSPLCGYQAFDDNSLLDDESMIRLPYYAKMVESLANYVQRCYSNTTSTCSPFVKQKMSSVVDRNATCPFAEGLCRRTYGNIKLDSGFIDTHTDLGLNAPPSLRAAMRHVTHCAPLITDGYKEKFKYSNDISYMRYYYGNPTSSEPGQDINFTYQYPELSSNQLLMEWNESIVPSDYSLS